VNLAVHHRSVSVYMCVYVCVQRKEKLDKVTEESEKKKANFSAGKLFGVSIPSYYYNLLSQFSQQDSYAADCVNFYVALFRFLCHTSDL